MSRIGMLAGRLAVTWSMVAILVLVVALPAAAQTSARPTSAWSPSALLPFPVPDDGGAPAIGLAAGVRRGLAPSLAEGVRRGLAPIPAAKMALAEADTDADGVPDTVDNCMAVPNADQADSNLDGVGDACDADGDGYQDDRDNCVSVSNPDQADSDYNGRGDACDLDADRDGVQDGVDNCPSEPNPEQADSDGDGIGNNCDTSVDPLQPDAMIALATSGPFRGQNVYASSPTAAQTQVRTGVQGGRAYSYTVRIQNDGQALDRFRIKATVNGSRTMRASFVAGGTDRTADVVAGNYKTAVLSPGKSSTLTITVTVSGAAPAGAERTVTLRVQSLASGTLTDVVRAVTRR